MGASGVAVQQSDVDGAAERLLAQGERPTVEKIRHVLGRGSPNTVAPMLNTWFKGIPARLQGAPADERAQLPPAIAKALVAVVNQAKQAAEAEMARERELLAGERRAVREQAAELHAREAARATLVETLQAQLAQVTHDLAEARQAVQQRERLVASLNEDMAAERRRTHQLAEQLATVSHEASAERQRLVEQHASNEKRLMLQVDEARTEAREQRGQAASTQKELQRVREAAEKKAGELTDAIQEARERQQAAQLTIDTLTAEGARVLQSMRELSNQHELQLHATEQLRAQLEEKDRVLHSLLASGAPTQRRRRANRQTKT